MVTVDDLKAKFAVLDVPPHGDCVIVPGHEFNPDWEVELEDQGYKCFNTDLDGHPVMLVRLKMNNEGQGERIVFSPDPKPLKRSNMKDAYHLWNPDEDAYLIGLWNREPRLPFVGIFDEFFKRYPKRATNAIASRIGLLQQRGRIRPRFTTKRRGEAGKIWNAEIVKRKGGPPSVPKVETFGTPEKAEELSIDNIDNMDYEECRKESEEDMVSGKIALPDTLREIFRQIENYHKTLSYLIEQVLDLEKTVNRLDGDPHMDLRVIMHATDIRLATHKHAVGSGEAVLPMEAPK